MEDNPPPLVIDHGTPLINEDPTAGIQYNAPKHERTTNPKRIIICCDGTWQSATSGKENVASNVTRLARCLDRTWVDEDGKIGAQIIWYDSGIGTTSSWVGQQIEGAFGNGLEVKVIEAYQFCVMNYTPGDKIMCFGFSRGAYTARSIAGLIADVGLCPRENLQTFHELWEFYKWKGAKKDTREERFFKDVDWVTFIHGVEADPADPVPPEKIPEPWADPRIWKLKPHYEWETGEGESWPRDVEVVGVYDTVGALGFPAIFNYQLPFGPDKEGFHNVQLSPHIKHAFHALALDEHRSAFSPTLWYLPEQKHTSDDELAEVTERMNLAFDQAQEAWENPNSTRDERERLDRQKRLSRAEYFKCVEGNLPQSELIQVWFPGCHVNIGGGSSDTLKEEGDLEALSHLAFAWMLDQISKYVSINRELYQNETEAHYRGIKQLNLNAETAAKRVREHEERVAKAGFLARLGESAKNAGNKVLHPRTAAPSSTAKVHQLTWGLGNFSDSYTTLYRLNGSWKRVPGNYTSVANRHNPQLGVTNEYIHPSVGYRMDRMNGSSDDRKKYGPYQWKEGEFVRQKKEDGTGYEYIVKGSTQPIEEWKLPSSGGQYVDRYDLKYERLVVYDDDAKGYIHGLDLEYGYGDQTMGNWFIETEVRS